MKVLKSDILVIGSGAAGLFFALKASSYADVVIITKKNAALSNTNFAQGGIASVMDRGDSFELHVGDTLEAGRGLCDRKAVEIMVSEGPGRIEELASLGVRFSVDRQSGALAMGREGGHSRSRIVHFGDMTGRELEETLIRACEENPSIEIVESGIAIDLVAGPDGTIEGCFMLERDSGELCACLAKHTVLATGGAGKIYLYTSNPDIATGDGIAMAWRAGAKVANLEFVQFHPTCLYHPDAKSRLISEALRGEGAILRNQAGREFMVDYDERRELAPRDIVARAIDSELKMSGEKYVLLDISHKPSEWLKNRFPYIYESCLEFGIDIGRDPIPVVPAAHYMVGGVRADIGGKTNLPGLSAIGEVACSGVHGANRLASNSLLESIVMAARCSARLESECREARIPDLPRSEPPVIGDPRAVESVILDHDWDLARRVMWDYVGIVRSDERLALARTRMNQIRETVSGLVAEHGLSFDIIELRNIALVSGLVIESALSRKESRGLHYNVDHPETDPALQKDTILKRGD
jgi:L-aspartate oxidase